MNEFSDDLIKLPKALIYNVTVSGIGMNFTYKFQVIRKSQDEMLDRKCI